MIVFLTFFALSIIYSQTVSLHKGIEESLDEWDFNLNAKELADSEWEEFKVTYKKHYKDEAEELYRKKIFIENSIKIAEHNVRYAKGSVYTRSKINFYGDFLLGEMKCINFPANRTEEGATFIPPAHVTFPDRVDWREEGAVGRIKNQQNCGACYAFTANAALEGQHFRKTSKLVSLSEQELVDCSVKVGNSGCDGGLPTQAYTYININRGIDTEESYPFEGVKKECRFNRSNVGATDRGFREIESGNEQHLKAAVAAIGPIAVAINFRDAFKAFTGKGVFYDATCDKENLDHGIVIIGYGTDPKDPHPDYWLIRNSWGEGWADKGYAKFARNQNNMCGIANYATYPLVN